MPVPMAAPPLPLPSPVPLPVPSAAPFGGWPAAAAASAVAPLPRNLARLGAPDLEGEVVDVRELQVFAREGCLMSTLRMFVGVFVFVMQPLLTMGNWVRGPVTRERLAVYVIGVRRADGGEEQARIEGESMGAVPRRGDVVSLWGPRRHGVLVLRRGFNHSVSAEIRVR
jgi:hypothetical protein